MSTPKGTPMKPCGKKKLSEGKAQSVVDAARRSRSANRQECRTYFCKGCGCWHTSSKPYVSSTIHYRSQL